jgi:hypothetical protein
MFRCVVFPIPFIKKNKVFSPEKCIELYPQEAGLLVGSVTWRRFVPEVDLLHDFGCRLAKGMNERTKNKVPRMYCGAYSFTVADVRRLVGADNLNEVTSANVIHKIEHGEVAHAEIQIRYTPGGTQSAGAGTRTAIFDRLWNAGRGALKHTCACDANVRPHPSDLLLDGPRGEYADERSPALRRWHRLRCRLEGPLLLRALGPG